MRRCRRKIVVAYMRTDVVDGIRDLFLRAFPCVNVEFVRIKPAKTLATHLRRCRKIRAKVVILPQELKGLPEYLQPAKALRALPHIILYDAKVVRAVSLNEEPQRYKHYRFGM